MKVAGTLAIGTLLAACGNAPTVQPTTSTATPPDVGTTTAQGETSDPLTPYDVVTSYNNYYEFTTDKKGVARLARDFKTSPWEITVGGLVNNPRTFGLEDLLRKYPEQERIYRMRCVEAWSMVIPWLGFPLSALLNEVEPTSQAKYVAFRTLLDPEQMPGQKEPGYPWPYTEGLRLDEAMNPLTLLATGLYGKDLPPQSGGPLRLVVPWKYGFKSAKAIVRIDLVEAQPKMLWNTIAPAEYGFYANVNPDVPHPRWPQASEWRMGEEARKPTLFLNGYAEEVGYLYKGMDLRANY
jgi:sulfoxide reductase catalytic subunit YedY